MSTPITSQQLANGAASQSGKVTDPKADGIQTTPGARAVKHLPPDYYIKFLSNVAKNRKPSPIRGLFPLERTPGLISLLAGKPNPSTFPFTSFNFTSRSPTDPHSEVVLKIDGKDLAQSLQYSDTSGLKQFTDWIDGLQEFMHGRKKDEGWRVSVGAGSQDLIYKAITAMINPGDYVLVESPVYAGVIPMFTDLPCHQIEVETDSQGISSSSLRSILESWPSGKPKPKVLYTVPYGCNPTGMTATLERRKEVLRLAREHDFIILEDDPYFYIYYGEAARPQSYFSLELEEPEVGRVLRFDSLSKLVSAGIRIGFASGPVPLLDAIDRHTATSNLQTPSLTQMIVFKLVESWGYEGFMTNSDNISAFYRRKRDVFERAMKTHLTGLAEWTTSEAGMFYWFKLLLNDNPGIEGDDGDSKVIIEQQAVKQGVLALPGTVFLPNGSKTAYVRAAFSLPEDKDVDEAIRRIRQVILDARATKISS